MPDSKVRFIFACPLILFGKMLWCLVTEETNSNYCFRIEQRETAIAVVPDMKVEGVILGIGLAASLRKHGAESWK